MQHDYLNIDTASTLSHMLEGRPLTAIVDEAEDKDKLDYSKKNWTSDDEGDAKLQKVIRKKVQSLGDPEKPFDYQRSKKNLLHHLLTWEFQGKEDDKRKAPKSADHIAKMQAGKKKTVKEDMEDYLNNL